jgi:CubicO group peptidase (beta-lactamase class C family)
MRLLTLLFAALISFFASVSLQAYPMTGTPVSKYQSLDTGFVRILRHWHLAGGAVAIIKNGKIIYSRGYGYANLADHRKVQPDTLFRVASISKAITASAVLSLVQAGKVKLSTPVFDYLGTQPLPGQTANAQGQTITIANLLYMTSGWSKWFDPMFGPWPRDYANRLGGLHLPVDCATNARFMMSQPLSSHPGTTFVYSNTNYCILGLVVAKASGMPYDTYVKNTIFKPLGVTDVELANTQLGMQDPREAMYYPIEPDQPETTAEWVQIHGLPYGNNQLLFKNSSDGGWVTSAPDLAKWADALFAGKIINNTLLNTMLQPPPAYRHMKPLYSKKSKKTVSQHWKYGMGWFLSKSGKYPLYYTHGSFTGTNAIIFKRHDGTIIVAIFNQKPGNYAGVQAVRNQVRGLFLNKV